MVCSPVSSPNRSRTFASALSERCPEPLDDRAVCDFLTRVGFEPNLTSLKDWQPHQKSNGPCCARTGCAKWVERCLNPRLRNFSPPLIRLSYRPIIGEDIAARTKKARCRGDTGLWRFSPNTAKRHKRRIWVESAVSFCKRADSSASRPVPRDLRMKLDRKKHMELKLRS
jgi:hypothetical protein